MVRSELTVTVYKGKHQDLIVQYNPEGTLGI